MYIFDMPMDVYVVMYVYMRVSAYLWIVHLIATANIKPKMQNNFSLFQLNRSFVCCCCRICLSMLF